MEFRRCKNCLKPRAEFSFYSDTRHPSDVCKSCIHGSRDKRVKLREERSQIVHRTQTAFRFVARQVQKDRQSYVYLLKFSGRFKIGFSTQIDKRIGQLETGCYKHVDLIAMAPGGRLLEQQLHREFAPYRTHREWFKHTRFLVQRFRELPGVMMFLPGEITETPPPA